ncbi:MAG: FecR family protein [Bacteroidota bacterium]
MKKQIVLFAALICFGINSFLPAQKKTDINAVAYVQKIVKIVEQRNSDKEVWAGAKIATPLPDGGQVKTGDKSLAIVKFLEGSLLRVRENSILNIYGMREGRKVIRNTYIDKGSVQFEVQKQGEDEFRFTTPTAVAAIRGTDGLIFCDTTVTRVYLENGELYIESTTDPTKNGKIIGGEKISVDQDGNIVVAALTDEDKSIIDKAKLQTTKKVIIKTAHGDVEIEYYTSDQK